MTGLQAEQKEEVPRSQVVNMEPELSCVAASLTCDRSPTVQSRVLAGKLHEACLGPGEGIAARLITLRGFTGFLAHL